MDQKKVLGSASLMLAAAFASAQSSDSIFSSKPIWISAGLNELLQKEAADASQSTGFQVGLGYHFKPYNFSGIETSPSLDFNWTRNSGHGGRQNLYSLLAMGRSTFSKPSGSIVPYYGLGIGVVNAQASVNGVPISPGGGSSGGNSGGNSGGGGSSLGRLSPSSLTLGRSYNEWNFAARALVGISFAKQYFAEAAYNYYGSVEGARLDSISVTVGVRF